MNYIGMKRLSVTVMDILYWEQQYDRCDCG